jgi:uncharacterized protein
MAVDFLLREALRRGDEDYVASLLLQDPHAGGRPEPSTGLTPLHYAAQGAPLPILASVLASNAARDARDHHGRTALWYAADDGLTASVEALLTAGADPTIPDDRGLTPLITAIRRGRESTVACLASDGRALDTPDRPGGLTPLHHAVLAHNITIVRTLIAAGVDRSRTNRLGKTAFELVRPQDRRDLEMER